MGPVGVNIGAGLICNFGDCRLGTLILCREAPLVLQAANSGANEADRLNCGGMVATLSDEGIGEV